MSSGPPTITQLKERFISAQTTLLARPPHPSSTFRASNEQSESPLDPRVLAVVTQVVEQLVQDHCRRTYAPQANRALAEQINEGYNLEAERRLERDAEGGEGIGKEADLVDPRAIDNLPAVWPIEKDVTKHPMEAKRFAEATDRLKTLNNERNEAKQRVERLRRIKTTIEPLQTKEGGVGIQENLITRNGELEKELDKMRTLLVRVAGRVGTLPEAVGVKKEEDEVKPLSELRKRNIDDFLSSDKVFATK